MGAAPIENPIPQLAIESWGPCPLDMGADPKYISTQSTANSLLTLRSRYGEKSVEIGFDLEGIRPASGLKIHVSAVQFRPRPQVAPPAGGATRVWTALREGALCATESKARPFDRPDSVGAVE